MDEAMFRITCGVDDSDVLMNISNDNDVLSMFSRNANKITFDVFVEFVEVNNSRRDSDLNVPLSQLARKRRKSKDQIEAQVGRKRKVATVAQPPAQVSSSQPLFKTQQVPPMHAAGSSSQPQPPSHLGAPYLPPSFWRGIGVSPQREIRSKNKNDDKELNSETCTQQ
ncbi:hypothetical protein Salat_1719200 [Sesamum alatum]|uniref:Uncharacterized protein n=1 Tax=Sesamum alatum TaxID=300844 RepID=A0AAE2CK88_9LAMI|nr:hypothetical protein Salat_1719200 [Sesamum alatum]